MIKKLTGEVWKPLQFPGHKTLQKKYALSNLGRMASYTDGPEKDGVLLKGSLTSGYRTLNLHVEGKNGTFYLHREVARIFCAKKSNKANVVVHINHKRTDNAAKNLKWMTADEAAEHQQKSPLKIAYKKKQAARTTGTKLTATQVKTIKQMIANPKRKLTYKQMAEKYGVSEMTLFRIRSGENWGKVK
jgi:hypothetical protein